MVRERFRKILKQWYAENRRSLPWAGVRDPYLVWLSEVILQQTRVEQGLAYYARFAERFPAVSDLAGAGEDEVMKCWEGLGYYSRARNLHRAAQRIVQDHGGHFPGSYDALLALPGVGIYTASAVASFAYGQPYPLLDANGIRVIARIFGIRESPDTAEGKKIFHDLAFRLIDTKDPANYNQAMMDFGSLVCKPVAPLCASCPFAKSCQALQHGMTQSLPVKRAKKERKRRHFHFAVLCAGSGFLLCRRGTGDIWRNLYQFPMHEAKRPLGEAAFRQTAFFREITGGHKAALMASPASFRQQLTHQDISGKFFVYRVARRYRAGDPFFWADRNAMHNYAFPGIIRDFMREFLIFNDR